MGKLQNRRKKLLGKGYDEEELEDEEEELDDDEYEDDDDAYEVHKIPCDKRLAAFILNYTSEIDIAAEYAFWKNNEFADSYTIKDFIIED